MINNFRVDRLKQKDLTLEENCALHNHHDFIIFQMTIQIPKKLGLNKENVL